MIKPPKVIGLFFIFLNLACAIGRSDETIVLTLDQAIAIALRDNRDIALNQEKLAQAKLKIEEALGGFLPEVTLSSAATDTRGYYAKDIINYSFSANLKQYLYRGGKTTATLKQNEYKKEAQSAALDKFILDTIGNTKKAFYTLYLAKEFNRINQEIFNNSKEHLEIIQARYEKGEASESEVLKAQANVASLESAYQQTLDQKEQAVVLLKNILYLEDKAALDIEGRLEYSPREIAVDAAILQALSARPEIKEYEAQEKSDQMELSIAKSGNRPSLYASFDYNSRSTTSLSFSPTKGWQDYNVVGVTLSWPIFDGWRTKSKIAQAVSSLKQDQLMKDKLKIDILTQVKDGYLSLKTAMAGIVPREKDRILYEDSLKVIEAQYTSGLASQEELEDARLKLLVSQFNHTQALYDCLIAKVKLDSAMGVK